MGKTVLVEQHLRDGERLLKALDQAGLQITAALWYYETESSEWRLVIASRALSHASSLEGYGRIQQVVRSLPGLSFALHDISMVQPDDPLVQTLAAAVTTGPGISGIRMSKTGFDRLYLEDAYIYRLTR